MKFSQHYSRLLCKNIFAANMNIKAQICGAVFVISCFLVGIADSSDALTNFTGSTTPGNTGQATAVPTSQMDATTHNASHTLLNGTITTWYMKNEGMLHRTLYVILGVTAIVVVYFGIRAWRTRRRKNKSRKYGLISTGADLEMEPLGNDMDDDEDDMTVFEQNGRRK